MILHKKNILVSWSVAAEFNHTIPSHCTHRTVQDKLLRIKIYADFLRKEFRTVIQNLEFDTDTDYEIFVSCRMQTQI